MAFRFSVDSDLCDSEVRTTISVIVAAGLSNSPRIHNRKTEILCHTNQLNRNVCFHTSSPNGLARLKYEHLSPEAIQAAKLFWFDSIGCALGGSQQEDAKILLKHHRAMGGGPEQVEKPPHSSPASKPTRSTQHS